MELNNIQSRIPEKLDREILEDLMEFYSTVTFIQNLTNPQRKRAKDLPKDEKGRIIVDITNPHILEDTDYFRPAAIHYKKFKKYTNLFPNSSPNSEYRRFWREEARRCRDGYVRESDGEWIPGSMYFYLNYTPILKNTLIKGTKRTDRDWDFPDFYDGYYLMQHYTEQAKLRGEHSGALKRRGIGNSYGAGSDLARIAILGENSIKKEGVTAFAIASETEYLVRDGVLNKFVHTINWCASNTPWPRLKLKDSLNDMMWTYGYVDQQGIIRGTQNSIVGVTTKGDPDKARGKRGTMYFDEWGKFVGLLKAWNVAKDSVEEGGYTHSTLIGAGTGGTASADFAGAEEMFYNPDGYGIYALPNVYDKNTNGKTTCAYFFPAYLNRLGFYDKDGNSDVVGALIDIIKQRIKVKYNSTDPNTLVQGKAEMPIVPQEAIMRREGSIFPLSSLKDYLAEIIVDQPKFTKAHYVGNLKVTSSGNVEWDLRELHPVLRNYPLKDELDKVGSVEIFEMPHRLPDGSIPRWRYIAGIDPIDSDEGVYTESLGSIFIFDLWTDRIVAEYSGRPQRATEFYEVCVKMLKFYNAIANYENNIKGFFQYCDATRNLQYLCDTPMILRDMDLVKSFGSGNQAKGCHANKQINAWGRKLQADWMVSDAFTPQLEPKYDVNGNLIEPPKALNLHKIRSIGYLKELLAWNPDGNFDRISAMGMVMILRADRAKFEQHKYEDKVKTIFDDPWFGRTLGKPVVQKKTISHFKI
jgi:hypothetical protein